MDPGIAKILASKGIPVVGLSTLKYFWHKKTPEQTSEDLKNIIVYYLEHWKKEKLLLIGYSFGAEVLPFMINGLPENLKSKIELAVLISPTKNADFEFHLTNWLNITNETRYPVIPQIEKFKQFKTLCIYGKEDNDKDNVCTCLDKNKYIISALDGGHHFNSDYQIITNEILKKLK